VKQILRTSTRLMDESAIQYRFWSEKMAVEGPMELPALVAAIKSNRVRADTWLYLDHERQWVQASKVPELKLFFRSPAAAAAEAGSGSTVKPGVLRRIKLFAEMDESQLEGFVKYMDVLQFKQFATVVTAGDYSDAMYLVLEGELRARNLVGSRETTLATLGVGEFFGEISLLDHGPRSADVIANQPSVLLKISAPAVERIVRESPALAAPFLYALSRSVVGRFRALTKKYEDSIHFARLSGRIAG
jgi:Cyclic nucleotide-binding domain